MRLHRLLDERPSAADVRERLANLVKRRGICYLAARVLLSFHHAITGGLDHAVTPGRELRNSLMKSCMQM